ncbi:MULTISPECIES: tail fiber protein [unclassified Bradyrhizobium]|uniref:phage tail protein n=1 Tax=unclassified Bradyrhizobium TaxID=2631580 RepID=UPI0024784033|nr:MULTISPECIES: tail fiber protein [unclassified Bradyrhizobium]WGR67838.1 tail fiber protein [Bradyrhizobium sp. ISRA426]WGR79891.1 tail fiber protein [Bradyrhizobium sp. ISRA430]WGR83077.1 tail fiber protein [Bradyrhizobium sp. ISRA432]
MTGVAWWSQTAASNATQDPTVGWAEGQSPSSVNDSARAMMASAAKWRDDISGAITTGGVATAYTVASNQNFDSLSRLANQVIAFTPHTTCGATVTLSVDGLGAKPLRSAPNVELAAGHLVQGTPYVAIYNNGDGVFYLQGFYGNPYNTPIGGVLPYTGTSAPNSSFVLPYGQAISRTTYSTYFGIVGTTYGGGDGSTTFNIIDLRGRVVAGKDDMGGVAANRLTAAGAVTGTTLGYAGGAELHTLSASQLPTINSSGTASVTSTEDKIPSNTVQLGTVTAVGGAQWGIVGPSNGSQPATIGLIHSTGTATVASTNTAGGSHNNVQPTIILNYLLRII